MSLLPIEALQSISFLRGLGPEQLRQVATVAELRSVPPETVIARQGEPADALFAVVTGSVRVTTRIHAGQECNLGLVMVGEVIGEVGLVDGGRRAVTCVTQEASSLLVIERQSFLPLLGRSPAIASGVMAALASRLRELTHCQLSSWSERGFVQVAAGRLVISDIEGVRRLARVAPPTIPTYQL